jgi:3-oxoadipate enol-lactonase
MADDVVAVLDALDVQEPVVVAGISMGGYVALALARRHPGRLRALLLADTKAEADSEESKKGRAEAIARVEGGDLAGYLESIVPKQLSEVTRTTKPEVVAKVRALGRDADPIAIVHAMEALRDRPDARAVLSTIRVPVAVVCGALDEVTPPSVVKPLAGAIPGATYEEIPGAAHFPNLEAPDAFRRVVRELVARAASAPR